MNKCLQVKMFIRHSLEDIERELNDWMGRQQIRICHVAQSQCEKQGKFLFLISIFYESDTFSDF